MAILPGPFRCAAGGGPPLQDSDGLKAAQLQKRRQAADEARRRAEKDAAREVPEGPGKHRRPEEEIERTDGVADDVTRNPLNR